MKTFTALSSGLSWKALCTLALIAEFSASSPALAEWRFEEDEHVKLASVNFGPETVLLLLCPKKGKAKIELGVYLDKVKTYTLSSITYNKLWRKPCGWIMTEKNTFGMTNWNAIQFLLGTWNDNFVRFTFENEDGGTHVVDFDVSGSRENVRKVMKACNYNPEALLQMGLGAP